MAKKRRHYQGTKIASGARIAAKTQRVWVCQACGVQHRVKPGECMGCAGFTFDTFDSIGEANYWAMLLVLEKQGQINDLHRQVRMDLFAARPTPSGLIERHKVGQYIADFAYTRTGTGERVIADYKGSAMTDLAAWKLRHMEAQGTPVQIVK